VLDKFGDILGKRVDGVGRVADVREPVSPLVVTENREVTREPDDNVAPDAEIGTKRIDEDQAWLGRACRDQLVMKGNPLAVPGCQL
jgi:hypothetical protein